MTTSLVPPGPGFVADTIVSSGISLAAGGPVAQLLIIHPEPRRAHETPQSVEDGMRRLAAALHLGPATAEPPAVGSRIIVRSGLVALDYGHDEYVMAVPTPTRRWRRTVAAGAPCLISLIVPPVALPLAATQDETAARLRAARGTVLWGTTTARRRI